MNDNVYKLLLAYFLISLVGPEHSNIILALAGGLFVIPFLLFASVAGTLADRYSKRDIILITRFAEILIVSLGIAAFYFKSAILGYSVLFLMATQSALFSPCKYGIIPEIVPWKKVSRYNGFITATTYLAIIIGTFLASFLTDVTHKNFIAASTVCIAFAVAGAFFSTGITRTAAQAKEKKVTTKLISEIYRRLKKAKRTRYLLPAIIFNAYFLFFGAYLQLNMIPFVMQSLHLNAIEGGYLFLMTALGIGIGSYLAGKFSKHEVELGFAPLAAIGISIVMIGLYIFASYFYVIVVLMILLGILGGFYVVPLDAYIQVASPSSDRGENVAASNFLNFTGVILASLLLAFLGSILKLSAASGFLIVGILTGILSFLLSLFFADQILRLFVRWLCYFFWDIKVFGKRNIRLLPPSLLITERKSWLDTLIVMAVLPRAIRYIVPIKGRFLKSRSWLYRLFSMVPLDMKHFTPIGENALEEIHEELSHGHSVCLMLPVIHPVNGLQEWENQVKELLKESSYPIIPIYIERLAQVRRSSSLMSYFKELKAISKSPIIISFGKSIQSFN